MDQRLYLGTDYDHKPFWHLVDNLTQGTLVVAQTGFGKTALLFLMALQLLLMGIPVWWIDVMKADGLFLASLFPSLLHYFRINKNFLFNPFEPTPGRTLKDVVNEVIEIFCRDFDLLIGSESHLSRKLIEKIEEFRQNEIEHPITFHDAEEAISEDVFKSGRMNDYKAALFVRLGYLLNAAGWTLGCFHGFSIEKLKNMSFVLDMTECPTKVMTFLLDTLINAVVKSARALRQVTNHLKLAIFIDEANLVLPKYQELNTAQGIPTLSYLSQICREFGIGLVCASQTPSFLADSGLKSQSYMKILLVSLGSNADWNDMGDVMGLTPEQVNWMKLHGEPGRAIVKLAGGENTKPFILKVPFLNIKGIEK